MQETPDPPKSKFRRIIRWSGLIIGAFAVFAAGFMIAASRSLESPQSLTGTFFYVLIHVIGVACGLAVLAWLFRWGLRHLKWFSHCQATLFTWRTARWLLASLVILATLIAVFYAEENWRGKRAWEKCKRDLEAKGEVLAWSAYVPAPIPTDQNIMAAPNMGKWFYKHSPEATTTNSLSAKFSYWPLFEVARTNTRRAPVLIARIIVGPAGTKAKNAEEITIQLAAPETQDRLRKIIQDTVGPSASGSVGFVTFVQHPPSQISPKQVFLQTDNQFTAADLSQLIPSSLVPSNVGRLRIEADSEPGSFRVLLAAEPTVAAEEYLSATDAGMPQLNLVREALQRPQIRMEGNYQRPFEVPIVNFVAIRTVAQVVAQRAQCCLLLGRSEQAFHELSFVYELRRLLASKPTLLVSAMIDVAISGLYVGTIADGLRLQAWREPELVALQKQLETINLPSKVAYSLRTDRAAVCQTFLVLSARDVAKWDDLGDRRMNLWKMLKKLTNPRYVLFKFAPRGWIYQNLAVLARTEQTGIETFEPKTQLINPRTSEDSVREYRSMHRSAFTILAGYVVPNINKAMQVTARNQTLANQAYLVCGLERYHLAHGEYPETLDVLVPQFVEKLPRDIIGGQPLHYRRTLDGKFLLYSVGWNGTDDGGALPVDEHNNFDSNRGDWVWQMPDK